MPTSAETDQRAAARLLAKTILSDLAAYCMRTADPSEIEKPGVEEQIKDYAERFGRAQAWMKPKPVEPK